jgi:integrase
MKLTQTNLSRVCVLASDEQDKIFFDDEVRGFGLRVRKGGSRKFVVHYRQGGIQRRHTIGPASVLTVDQARVKARKVLVDVDDGKDPAAAKIAKHAAAGLIFASVMRDYLAVRAKDMKPRSLEETTRHLKRAWKPLHRLALSAVSRPVVAARLRELASGSGPVAADRARSTLSALFGWAIGEGLCDGNPVMGTNKASDGKPRERVLSDAELAAVWQAAPDNDYGRIVRLLMLTGQRRLEIGDLCWAELEGEGETALIALPSHRTKNGRQHDVPLSALARQVLEGCKRRAGRDHVFGDGEGGYSGWSKSKAALNEVAQIKPWVLHDLRRTTATRMADLGVYPHVIEAILNHVSGHKAGVAGIYNRSSYAAEKRAALDLWAAHVAKIIA